VNAEAYHPTLALPLAWYARAPLVVARELLGCVVVAACTPGLVAGRIVEAEAYGGAEDPASHASFRRSGLVEAMWGAAGTAYVYRAYGVYPCHNVVTGREGEPAAVLIRALELLAGAELAAERLSKVQGPRLAAGPGLTGRALGVTTGDNGRPLDRAPLWIQPGETVDEVVTGPRIGVSRGRDQLWRCGIAGHPALSKPFPRTRSGR
jgi:DNA-3-methyladenine glycosylase